MEGLFKYQSVCYDIKFVIWLNKHAPTKTGEYPSEILQFSKLQFAKKIWLVINTIASIWYKNLLGYFSLKLCKEFDNNNNLYCTIHVQKKGKTKKTNRKQKLSKVGCCLLIKKGLKETKLRLNQLTKQEMKTGRGYYIKY